MLNAARVSQPRIVDLIVQNTALGGDLGDGLASSCEDWLDAGEVPDAPQDHVAVRRRDLTAVAHAVEHVGRGNRGAATREWVFCGVDGYVLSGLIIG